MSIIHTLSDNDLRYNYNMLLSNASKNVPVLVAYEAEMARRGLSP